jgi:hypothetical protein
LILRKLRLFSLFRFAASRVLATSMAAAASAAFATPLRRFLSTSSVTLSSTRRCRLKMLVRLLPIFSLRVKKATLLYNIFSVHQPQNSLLFT